MFDHSSETGKKVVERLQRELVIWLTTVREDGTPFPTPVWFLWEDPTFLIFTQPTSLKLRNIAKNPRATLNLNSDQWGGSLVIFQGEIHPVPDEPAAGQNTAYIAKYRQEIANLNMTPESFAGDYSAALRFTPARVRIET
jgi:PPOX class probable F420-dependent enzyme